MDTRQVNYLLEIRKTMSLNQAAESLGVSQPTLSYQLKQIEREVGFEIFERNGRNMAITPAGDQLCSGLFALRTELRKLIEHCQNISGTYRQDIRVGLPVRSALRLLPDAVRRFSEEYSDVSVTPVFHPYGDFTSFLSGGTDMEFTAQGELDGSPGVREDHLFYSGIYLITRDDDPLASKDVVGVEDMGGRLLMVGGGSPPELIAVQQRVIRYADVGYYNSHDHDTTMVNVAVGKGVCLSPGFLKGDDPGYRWIPFDCPERFDCVLCTKANDERAPVRRFVEIMKELYDSYDGYLRDRCDPSGAGIVSYLRAHRLCVRMAKGILGIIICPMLGDNLVHSLGADPEEKDVVLADTGSQGPIARKLGEYGIPYSISDWGGILSGDAAFDRSRYTVLVYALDLGLHARPDVLRDRVESLTRDMQHVVDAIGYYIGTCGNEGWDLPAWCSGMGFKPSATFRDLHGNLCPDCVGVNIAGGPRYLELMERYPKHIYVFPAFAVNKEEFNAANNAASEAAMASLDEGTLKELGIEPGPNAYERWLLRSGGYEYYLRIETGLGDREEFEAALEELRKTSGLLERVPDEEWGSLQPTDDLYAECKTFLA